LNRLKDNHRLIQASIPIAEGVLEGDTAHVDVIVHNCALLGWLWGLVSPFVSLLVPVPVSFLALFYLFYAGIASVKS
jgi:hypothetical protein